MFDNRTILAHNFRKGFSDGVEVIEKFDFFSLYRYIEDWDEDRDTTYEIHEFLIDIPGPTIRSVLGVKTDRGVTSWFKKNLLKKQSNSLDAIQEFFDKHTIPYRYTNNRQETLFKEIK